MSRYHARFDREGKCIEFIDGVMVWCRPGYLGPDTGGNSPTVLNDLPDFVSPIDGSIVHGRAGLRDHCVRHNVVPTQELKGLPNKLTAVDNQSKEYRSETKRVIGEILNEHAHRARR